MVAVGLTVPLVAQWVPVPANSPFGNRFGFSLVPWANGDLLMFGGDAANPAATELLWNGAEWTPVLTPVPRRVWQAIAVDAATGQLLLFGGTSGTFGPFTDTWSFSSGTWTQLFPPASPPPLLGALSMAADPQGSGFVLVGAQAGAGQTWRFSAGNWTQVNTFTPLTGPLSVVADTVRRDLLLVNGNGATVQILRLDGTAWTLVAQTGLGAVARAVFDPDRGRIVITGSSAAGTIESVEWDGLSFVAQPQLPITGFFASANFAVGYHHAHKAPLIVDATVTARLYRSVAAPVPLATAYGTTCVDPTFRLSLWPGDSPQPGTVHRLLGSGTNGAFLTLSVLGLSHVQYGAVPLPAVIPLGPLGCLLRAEPLAVTLLGTGLPRTQLIALPGGASLLGQRYDAQLLQFDASGVLDSSNGLEVQIGLPRTEHVLLESFASAANRDPLASGDVWANGEATPVAIGGDGRHGSFDPAHGVLVAPGVYQWSTDNQLIPSGTLSGSPAIVTDGRFYFTDFVVPAGVTVRWVGAVPAVVTVRGRVDVQGTVISNAAEMPFFVPTSGLAAGQRVSSFRARSLSTSPFLTPVAGQPGGTGGCGGGRGGDGGTKCLSAGPIIVSGVALTNGQPGADVRVAAGHAYAAAVAGTGGRGAAMHPATGLPVNTPLISGLYRAQFSPGGGGGGLLLAGAVSSATLITASIGPAPAASALFPLLPFPVVPPPGYQSLDHFTVGGSGGGGGGSHNFGTIFSVGDQFMAGHGGSGGGGAFALRGGGDLTIGAAALLAAKGGQGVLITGDDPTTPFVQETTYGISSPGGGGSGGSVLLQSGASLSVLGTIDTSGGLGSRNGLINPPILNVQAQAGAGSSGFYRLEASGTLAFAGTPATVPAYVAANNAGPLNDRDDRTGSRSVWLLAPATALPVWLRYELVADVGGGNVVLFSDDPAISPNAANDPAGPVLVRYQGARLGVSGAVDPATIGPWRPQVVPALDSLNRDRATVVRFDLVMNRGTFPGVRVRELRLYWR
ncbi:MAG: kelch repeat-containing protein [Planctomycetota bacterium]